PSAGIPKHQPERMQLQGSQCPAVQQLNDRPMRPGVEWGNLRRSQCPESALQCRILPACAVPEAHLRRTSCSDATSDRPFSCSVDIPWGGSAGLTTMDDTSDSPFL